MALDPIDASCGHCGSSFTATPERTFLGFQRVTCALCREKSVYPLTNGFRVTYIVLVALMFIYALNAFGSGGYAYPGGVGLAILFALYRDWKIRSEVSQERLPTARPSYVPQAHSSEPTRSLGEACQNCRSVAARGANYCSSCGTKLKNDVLAPSNPTLRDEYVHAPPVSDLASPYVEQAPALSISEQMSLLGITYEGKKYRYKTYTDDMAADAVKYARQDQARTYKCK